MSEGAPAEFGTSNMEAWGLRRGPAGVRERTDAVAEFQKWQQSGAHDIQRAEGSAWYRLREAEKTGDLLYTDAPLSSFLEGQGQQVFVIEHDWSSAFAGAVDFDEGEFRPPYPRSVFEFRMGGKRLVAIIQEAEGDQLTTTVFANMRGNLWFGWPPATFHPAEGPKHLEQRGTISRAIYSQIRALCIALEAEVAVTSPVRAPHKLNKQREKSGREPLNEYHAVKLANRSRVEPLPGAGSEPKRKVRLHFRRGHWRHFSEHKTWVKWCLVGDPDLGFIDKHYRA